MSEILEKRVFSDVNTSELVSAIEEDNELALTEEREREEGMESVEDQMDSLEKDREQVNVACEGVDEAETERESFRELLDRLYTAKQALDHASATEQQMAVPLKYDDSRQRDLFHKCLGLEFKITADKAVCLVFQHLDPTDLERTFCITMDVDQHNQWTVVGMEPTLHGVRAALNELNRSGNFSHFCRDIRTKFKELATEIDS